jgi:hypothetical protein
MKRRRTQYKLWRDPTFWRNISHPFSGQKNKPSKKPAKPGSKLSWILKVEAECASKTSGSLRTTRCYSPQDRTFHSYCRENLKSNIASFVSMYTSATLRRLIYSIFPCRIFRVMAWLVIYYVPIYFLKKRRSWLKRKSYENIVLYFVTITYSIVLIYVSVRSVVLCNTIKITLLWDVVPCSLIDDI